MIRVKNEILLCIVDYYSEFPILKRADSLAADDLVTAARIVLTEFGLPKETISDAGMNFTTEMFKQFCGQVNIEQAIT